VGKSKTINAIQIPKAQGGEIPSPMTSTEVYFVTDGNQTRKLPTLAGPAIILNQTSTIMVEPGWQAEIDSYGSVINEVKDELSRVKELLLGKENRVKQLESECNTLREENQRLDTNMSRKEEQLKVHTREIVRLKKKVESLQGLWQHPRRPLCPRQGHFLNLGLRGYDQGHGGPDLEAAAGEPVAAAGGAEGGVDPHLAEQALQTRGRERVASRAKHRAAKAVQAARGAARG
jgi:hypothetical protein